MRDGLDDPGPGQRYATAARKNIAELRRKEPGIRVEIRWCPGHCGVEGNEIVDVWAKQAGRPQRGMAPIH